MPMHICDTIILACASNLRRATLVALVFMNWLIPAPSILAQTGGYAEALKDGKKTIPYAREFNELFPKAWNFYSYYTGEARTPVWNSMVGLYGRYTLTMRVDVSFDKSRKKVVSYGKPKFQLLEVEEIEPLPQGRAEIHLRTEGQRDFGEEEWKKLVEAKGDFEAIGITLIKDKPVKGFDQHWK